MPNLDESIKKALKTDMTVDITTTGRKSGQPSRIEIWAHYLDELVIITGTPGTRDWYANLLANPRMTLHLKGDVSADLPAVARPVTDEKERRAILTKIKRFSRWPQRRNMNVEERLRGARLIVVDLEE